MDDIVNILKGLGTLYESDFILHLRKVIEKYQDIDLTDALSTGQINSKKWLISELEKLYVGNMGTIFVLGGWYGTLSAMLFESELSGEFEKIRSFDIDPSCEDIADTMNRKWVKLEWKFKASTADMYRLDYSGASYKVTRSDDSICDMFDKPDTVINTCCEHLEHFDIWFDLILDNTLVILQSNNHYEGMDHVNCVDSLEDFKKQAPLSNILYEGELDLGFYSRYMLIGKK